jgi:hypothetical protein
MRPSMTSLPGLPERAQRTASARTSLDERSAMHQLAVVLLLALDHPVRLPAPHRPPARSGWGTLRARWTMRGVTVGGLVTFERDEGQEYPVGTRVGVHAMDAAYRTLALDPGDGAYVVTRCERIRDVGWRALRVSLTVYEARC